MRKKFQKLSMAVAAIVLFAGVMLLSVERNDVGKWEFATLSSFAQGGEGGEGGESGGEGGSGIVQLTHKKLKTITTGVNDFADGQAHLYRGVSPGTGGIAVVTTPSYTLQSVLYTKTGDSSKVVYSGGGSYYIGYTASFTTSGPPVGTINVFQSFNVSI